MHEQQSEIVVEMAKKTIDLLRANARGWHKGYVRFYMDDGETGANGCFAGDGFVDLIGALDHNAFYQEFIALGERLFQALQKTRGVLLLQVDASFDYEAKFEWKDLAKWRITKLDGRSGLPDGL